MEDRRLAGHEHMFVPDRRGDKARSEPRPGEVAHWPAGPPIAVAVPSPSDEPGPLVNAPRSTTLAGSMVALEPLARGHLADLEACCEEGFYAHMPGGPFGPCGFEGWFERLDAGRRAGTLVPFALVHRASGRAIGVTSLSDISLRDERVEIGGTWIARAHQRTAANTEMKLLLMGHCFDALGAGRVTLKTGGENIPSQRAIERLGAHREGVLRRHMRLDDGRWRDTVYYSVLAPEWPAIRDRLEARPSR